MSYISYAASNLFYLLNLEIHMRCMLPENPLLDMNARLYSPLYLVQLILPIYNLLQSIALHYRG